MTTIIGLTGSFGSGCTYIGKEFIVDLGYEYLSLSTVLKEDFKVDHSYEPSRQELQDYGNKKRENEGSDTLAKELVKIIKEKNFDKCVIDSIRNPHEIEYLKDSFSEFYLLNVFADYQVRWDRVKTPDKYDGDQKMFNSDDLRDRDEELNYGQRVRDCCDKADIVISNNKNVHNGGDDYKYLKAKVEHYVNLIEHENKFEPTNDETLMAMAYANSFRSHCLKRKVGAIIIDNYGNVFSSGLNNTPVSVKPCIAEYGECVRDHLRDEYTSAIEECVKDIDCREQILERFKAFKILDYCRALHAEETAILNAAKIGSSSALIGSTLYTTTYPCNLCANKIVKVGITKIVYAEPYPMIEAKKILKQEGVEQISFEGVSFNGYFRVGGN